MNLNFDNLHPLGCVERSQSKMGLGLLIGLLPYVILC